MCNIDIFPNKNDILRHGKSERHISLFKVIKENKSMHDILTEQSHFYNVRKAELMLAAATTELNISFNCMDTLSPLLPKMFPDSKIAKDFACKRTKSTIIIKDHLAKYFQQELVILFQQPGNFFSLIMDETTDVGTIKQCAFTIIFYCNSKNKVVIRFFDMVEVSSGKATDLYETLKSCLEKKKIPLNNLIGFASDTTNVMVGEHNSVFSHLRLDLPEIVLVKCSCHMIHLCASKACLELPRRVEDVLRNIGAYFSRSFSRQEKFKEFQEFFGSEVHKILLPSQTRWLSLEQCCKRILEQYKPLQEYFRLVCFEDPSITNDHICETLNNKYTQIYLEFMVYVLNLLNNFNTMFQSETPLLYKLKPEVTKLLKTLCFNYIEFSQLRNIDILKFDHANRRNFVDLKKLYIGIEAYNSLEMLQKEENFDKNSSDTFLTSCLSFYITLVSEIKKRFTFEDNLFDLIDVLDPHVAQNFEVKSLVPIIKRFSFLQQYVTPQTLDNEWRNHALLDHKNLGLNPNLPADEYWSLVFKLKNAGDIPTFKNLKTVFSLLLILPFSNASVERLFSNLKNIKTDLRNRMGTDTAVAVMTTKDGLKSRGGVLNFKPPDEMLKSSSLWKK